MSNLQVDDIKTQYHPCSGTPAVVHPFDEYQRYSAPSQVPESSEPWFPFQTQGDFESAAFALDAGLNKEQTNTSKGYILFEYHIVVRCILNFNGKRSTNLFRLVEFVVGDAIELRERDTIHDCEMSER